MSASVTLRNGVVVPIAETAHYVAERVVAATETELLDLHLDDRGAPGASVRVRAAEIALVIDTTPAV